MSSFEGKKLMVLGAGIYQVPLIRKAKEMGIYTIAVSIPGNYPGFSIADKCLYVNTTDSEGVLKAATDEEVDGICTTGTDVCVPAMANACEILGLPGISRSAAALLSDKCTMKQMFKDGGVRTADFRVVQTLEEAADAVREIGFPVMVKAPDSSGSRGITAVDEADGLEDAFSEAMRVSRSGRVIVEKCLKGGYEIGLDAFVKDGRVVMFLPHDKKVYRTSRAGMPAGHAFPFSGDGALTDELKNQLERAVLASGADNCAINSDIMIVDGVPWFLEMGGRCGATGIPELITIFTGVDYYGLIIETALGTGIVPEKFDSRPCMSRLIFSDRTGTVTHIDEEGLKAIMDSGTEISLDVKAGDEVFAAKNGTDRIGQLIIPSNDDSMADRLAKMAGHCIFVDGKPICS